LRQWRVRALIFSCQRLNSPPNCSIANSALVEQVTLSQGTNTVSTLRQYDNLNRLTSIGTTAGGVPLSFGYRYSDANQRTNVASADGSYWYYHYDALGQVDTGKRYWKDGTAIPGQQFGYTHDNIGNRTAAKVGSDQNATAYTPNPLNQYENRTVPSTVDITGNANAAASVTVTVGGQASPSVYRHNEYYQATGTVNNTNSPAWAPVTVSATRGGTNNTQSGNLLVPPATQTFQYDADGNLTSDLVWNYTWDAENRLIKMDCQVAGPSAQHLAFEYDWQGRRIHKVVKDANQNNLTDLRFLYDRWNLLAVLTSDLRPLTSFLWGLDLTSTQQGAGGVGGLLAITDAASGTHFVCYDGNGNVTALVKATDGSTTARYEYGPFGELLRATGPMAKLNPLRFSTKYEDDETDLVYYGYRYYSPSLGRWLTRDPLEEEGGISLYAFVGNEPGNLTDPFGMDVGDDGDLRNYWYWGKGAVKGLGKQIGGLWNLVTSPVQTFKGITHAIGHPDDVGPVIMAEVAKAMQDYLLSKGGCIDPGKALEMEGEIGADVVTMLVGVGEVSKATRFAKISELAKSRVAQRLSKVTKGACCVVGESKWQALPGGVQIKQTGNYWIKQVNPDASALAQWWGRGSLDAQAEGLSALAERAPSFLYMNGKLITRDAGPYTPGNFWPTWWEGTKLLGTPMNDIRPRNIGANGIIFDPALNPFAQGVYWIGAGTVAGAAGYGIYSLFGDQ
jgi:RHS repeat-associated protein